MNLYLDAQAKIKLDARLPDGHRLNVDSIVGAEYRLFFGGIEFLKKRLNSGITIENDAAGDGFLYVRFDKRELSFVGEYNQRLVVTDCSGNETSVTLRPSSFFVKE